MVVTELAPLGLRKLGQHNGASSIVTIKPADLIRKPFLLQYKKGNNEDKTASPFQKTIHWAKRF